MWENEIWVICDIAITGDKIFSLQLISKAVQLKAAGEKVVGVILKEDGRFRTDDVAFGVDRLLLNKGFKPVSIYDYISVLEQMIGCYQPGLILFPATELGRGIAAAVSVKIESGLTAECIDIERTVDNDFIFTRTALSSTIMAQIQCINCRTKMGTVRKNVFDISTAAIAKPGTIMKFQASPPSELPFDSGKLLDSVKDNQAEDIDISVAKVIFGVGRGVKKEVLPLLKQVAEKYRAEIIGTRAAVECNLLERARQVGQSGESIAPEIYIGFGISGASQHMVGIRNARMIIAVNHDANAPIFKYADYGICENVQDVLLAMMEEL